MKKQETYSYHGWLNSDSFWKRVFSITGYSALGSLVIYVFFIILIMMFFVFFP